MISDELNRIQRELKAPKGQYNSFGKYKYRSCEDILEAVKPILGGCTLILSDEIVEVGGRVYVKATATLSVGPAFFVDKSDESMAPQKAHDGMSVFTTAFAREPDVKKGMDESQITGTASSYARKYALNGLFCIDDSKDADTNEHRAATSDSGDSVSVSEINTMLGKFKETSGMDVPDDVVAMLTGDVSRAAFNGARMKLLALAKGVK